MGNAYRVRILLPSLSPTVDQSSYNFTFEDISAGGVSGNLAILSQAAISFINITATGATQPLCYYLSGVLNRGANLGTVNIYNITGHLDGSLAGAPVSVAHFTLGPVQVGVGTLPEGVACALSWRADYGLDPEFGPISDIPTPPDIIADYGAQPTHKGRTRPRARDRNRTYIGPLSTATVGLESSTNRCIFVTQFQNDLLRALFVFADLTSSGAPQFALRAWSRRNASMKIVTTAFLDDRPDFQRRRSDPSTVRTQLAMPAV